MEEKPKTHRLTPPARHTGTLPWIRLRSAASGPNLFKRMIETTDPKARPGDIVAVYDKNDAPYGVALFNPKTVVSLRLLTRGIGDFDADAFFAERIKRAVEFRRDALKLDKVSDAYRLVHDLGDGLPGIVIDRYADYIVLEFYTLAMFRQADRLERLLRAHFPDAKFVRRASPHHQEIEGFLVKTNAPARTRIKENGVAFEVEPTSGYKTGFFCDQRDNRLAFAGLAAGKKVLDVCSYTGGFGLYAMKVGGAAEVTSVELDPAVSALAKKNANINGLQIENVTVDAFPYLRQAAANGRKWGLVVLDPYKLIATREGYALGRQKYLDLNRLGFTVLEPGGILLTCSCSGMVTMDEFQQILRTSAGSAGRRVQIFKKNGASADHPFAVDHPEGEYLKAIWCRVL